MSQDKTFPLRLRIPIEWKTRLDKEAKDIGIKELREAGCSCYDPGWAVVEFHPDLRAANKAFAAWFEENGKERTL